MVVHVRPQGTTSEAVWCAALAAGSVLQTWADLRRPGRMVLARISHQSPAAAGDAPHPAVSSRLGVLSPPTAAQSGRRLAPRRAHRTRADGGETQAPEARRNVLSGTTPRPSGRKRRWPRHLAGLATNAGEKRGLEPETETEAEDQRIKIEPGIAVAAVGHIRDVLEGRVE